MAKAKKSTDENLVKETQASPSASASSRPEGLLKKSVPARSTKSKTAIPTGEVTTSPAANRKNGAAKRPAANSSSATPEQFLAVEQDGRELPLDYGDTKIVLMSRDPEWIFAYWEINSETRKKFGLVRGKHDKALTVRFHEVNDGNDKEYSDITVNDFTSSWYFKLPNGDAAYRADIGVIEKGEFKTIASSNTISVPRHGISEEGSVEFAEINDEVYSQIVQLSGGYHISERLGGEDFVKTLQQKVFQSLTSGPLFSGSLSGGFLGSSSLFSGSGFSGDFAPGIGGEAGLRSSAKPGEFWLEVGVDVIVYGATTPDAKVKFMGRDVRLTPDGTFRVRMVLPDSSIEFPVEAISADGQQKRRVKPVVSRTTSGSPHKPV